MYKLLVIARREFAAMVATKAFLFTLMMMPILMFGGILILPKLSKLDRVKHHRILVADGTGRLLEVLQTASKVRNEAVEAMAARADESKKDQGPFSLGNERWEFAATERTDLTDEDRWELSEQLRAGAIYGFLEIPANFFDAPIDPGAPSATANLPFVSLDSAISLSRQWIQGVLQQELRRSRLTALNLDPDVVARADAPLSITPSLPYTKSKDGRIEANAGASVLASLLVPLGAMLLMFMVIFLAAQPMLESAMEEKNQRIAEVLLGSVNPSQLMAGKLIGNMAGSCLIFSLYGIGSWFLLRENDWSQYLPWTLVPWFLLFQLLGVLLFSSVFMTIGAAVSEMKEAQSMLLPVWLVMIIPLMTWIIALRDPNGPLALAFSFFPPSAPMVMVLRLASGQVIPIWQPPLAACVLLATTSLIVWFAGRIYRASLLRQDSVKSIIQLFRRSFAG